MKQSQLWGGLLIERLNGLNDVVDYENAQNDLEGLFLCNKFLRANERFLVRSKGGG